VAFLASGGRENFFNGAVLQTLETVSAGAGFRYTVPNGLKLRFDASYIWSDPILSRGGVALGLERVF
jgi:hypothetical protein